MSALSVKIRASFSNRPLYGIIVLIIFSISLAFRISLPYENIFTGDWVKFVLNDPWYHIRLVENLVQNFPHLITFDPFTFYPYGQEVPFAPFFDLLLGFVIWVIGLGSPTQNVIETVGAYFPAILGALVVIPVYFIGRELFNRNVGLLSAALIAVLPGQFLFRSWLGFTDHHVAEVLFSTIAALFLILALKSAKKKETSLSHVRGRDWGNLKNPLIYSLLAGLALGIYLISWSGGLLFVLIILTYIVIQYIINHLIGRSTDYLCVIGIPMFLIASIMVIPFLNLLESSNLIIVALIVGVLTPVVLTGISRLMAYKNIKRAYYPLALAGLGILGIVFLYIIDPSLYEAAVHKIGQIFVPSGAAQTIGEVQPMLSIDGFANMIYFFTTGIIFALIALSFLIYACIKKRRCESTILFLVIWCLMMLLAMLGQNRFAYYFAVNVALLSGYVCWNILQWSWIYFREALPEREKGKSKVTRESEPEARSVAAKYNVKQQAVAAFRFFIYDPKYGAVAAFRFFIYNPKYFERYREKKSKREIRNRMLESEPEEVSRIPSHFKAWHGMAGVSIMVFLVAFVPNIAVTMFDVRDTSVGINEAWYSSLVWMRENTPDPFENPDFYYEVYERPSSGESYNYPDSAYGVMNVWESGHWITRIARRIPNSNPFQSGTQQTSRYFVTQNESDANPILDRLESKYVITDWEMATVKFENISLWGGVSEVTYWDLYYEDPANGGQGFITLYYPEYYQSMSIRLYTFGGKAVVPLDSTFVVSYEERSQLLREDYKEITSIRSFATYDEAQEFLESQINPNYRIVGMDPFTSAVPLDELEHYRLVHQSDPEIHIKKKGEPLPWVKIFEYIP